MAVTLEHNATTKEITVNKISIGGKSPTAIYKGGTEVTKVTKGSTVVYQKDSVTYGITVELLEVNDSTTYVSSCAFSTTSVTGVTMAAGFTFYYNASNFDLRIAATKNGSIQYGTNYITVGKSSGSFTGTLSTNTPHFLYRYAYQPNSSSSAVNRGTINIYNNIKSGFTPCINLVLTQSANTTVIYKINFYFCNFFVGVSVQSMSIGLIYNSSGSVMSSSTGGGFIGQTSWTNQRTLTFSLTSSFTGELTTLANFVYTTYDTSGSGLEGQPVGNVIWQIRVSSSQPTYDTRKTAGTQMYVGTGVLDDEVASALYSYSVSATTSGATRYMWLCEVY